MAEYGQIPGVQYYLRLKIKDNTFNPTNIKSLVIKSWIFNILPTIEITLIDDGYLIEATPMEDQEDIQVTLAKSEDDPNPIEMTFSLDDYAVGIIGDNRKSIVNLTGHLKVDDMFTIKTRALSKQNSSSVFETIASEAGLTFSNPNNLIPSDNMTWIQNTSSNFDFIKHVLRRVYIPDDVAFFYADISKKFVFNSLKSNLKRLDIKTAKFDVRKAEQNIQDEKDKTIWFFAYSIVNNSAYFNKKIGYGFEYNYWDLDNHYKKTYTSIDKVTGLSFRNKDLADKPVQKNLSMDYIEGNVYSEYYFESLLRNQFLKNNFFANSVILNVNSLSQIKLMDLLDVQIPSLLRESEINEVMSGKYLVAGIQHEVSSGGIYKKKVAIGRNGMNKSSYLGKTYQYKVEE